MATFYLDRVGGSDAADGTTFANRWLTFASGATAARTAPGDTIRIMASPNETSLGVTGIWTQDSKTITLGGALTANVSDCELAWTASANVTATAVTSIFKEGTKSANIVIAGAFTTGLAAYFATGTLDLSGYQQLSFWIQSNAVVAASTLSLRVCTDTLGAISSSTFVIPALPNTFGQWVNVTVDLGANMSAVIMSVALYCDLNPGAVTINIDNIIACKAASSADSLTLTSLIGKVWNLSWVASTAYAANDIRKPTQPNRNGFRYKVTAGGGGNSAASEPTWPLEIGTTVTDGALTWTCEGLEDTWYGIQSINGMTVKLDNSATTLGNAGRGYAGATETVTTYKREPIVKMGVNGTTANTVQEAGSSASPIIYSGGWNRTDMSTQTGETWLDAQNGLGNLYAPSSDVTFRNLNGVRATTGVSNLTSTRVVFENCHMNNHVSYGFNCQGASVIGVGTGICANNNSIYGYIFGTGFPFLMHRMTCNSNMNSGANSGTDGMSALMPHNHWTLNNNAQYGVGSNSKNTININNLSTRGNTVAGVFFSGDVMLNNALLTEATPISAQTNNTNYYIYSQKHNQTANNHLISTDGGTIISAIDQRRTASGISWKFRPTSAIRNSAYPLKLSVAKVAVSANSLVTVNIWTYRDSTSINGTLKVQGGQIAGVPVDVTVACAPTINTWVQSSNLTFTPTEAGVVEIIFEVYDGVMTITNFWVDDIVISQA